MAAGQRSTEEGPADPNTEPVQTGTNQITKNKKTKDGKQVVLMEYVWHTPLALLFCLYFTLFNSSVCAWRPYNGGARQRVFRNEIIISSVWTAALWLMVPWVSPGTRTGTSQTSPTPHRDVTHRHVCFLDQILAPPAHNVMKDKKTAGLGCAGGHLQCLSKQEPRFSH